ANGIEICSKPYSGSFNLNPSEPNFSSFTASGFYERRTNPSSNYNGSGVTDELDGRIDALKVFNRALSGDEILPYYQEGEGLSTVPDCPDGTIVAEYKINDQDWQTGTVMNVAEGDIVYIRARDYSAGEYFVTVPQAYAPTFSSVDDLEGSTFDAYRVDTGEPGLGFPDGDGIVDSNNVGQYVLTTAGGCIAVLDLQINCTNESIIPEYRLDGVWSSGENELTVVEGTEVMFSMLPNDIELTVTFPDGTVVGDDYNIGPVTAANAGIYTIRSIQGCSTTVDLTVTTFDCASFGLETEYSINGGTAVTGAATATVEEGADLLLSIIPDGVPYSISGPNSNNKPLDTSDLTITGISQGDSGVYTFITEDGCITTLDITISCSPESIIPEYNLDGQWFSGGSEINVIEGTEIILSMLPNEIDLVITLPDGTEVGDDYELGAVTSADAGTYTLRSEDGCVTTLDINISTFDCGTLGLESSYNLNGAGAVTGATTLRVNEGDNLEISLLPPGLAYSISGPNDMIKPTNTASYTFTGIGPTEGGVYTFRTEDGCTLDFEIIVDCVPGSIIAEYNLNGVWFSGEDSITIEEGTVVILSMLPNFIDVDITLPDGTVVGDNYELGSVTAADSGLYTFVSEEGCQTSLEIIVTTDTDCDTLGLEAAYSVNGGTIVSGENSLEVAEGDALSLSINPTGIAYSISGPNGNNKSLNTLALDLTDVVMADAGTYTFMTAEGCMVALDLTVVEGEPSCEEQNLETEYSLNGGTAITGASSITVDEGDTISLGIIPDGIAFSVSGPNSKALGLEDLLLSEVNLTDAGTYTFTTDAGCELSLQIAINPIVDPGPDCSALGLAVEYGINDENLVTGASKVNLFVGDDLLLSIIPDGIPFSISGANGNNKALDNTDLNLESVSLEDAGIYTFTTEEGCEVTLEVEIVAPEIPTSGNLEDIEVFPIPLTSKDPATRGILNVVLSDFMNEPIQFYVFDIYGKQALSKAVGSDHSETEQLDLSSLSSGFYLLDIQRVNVDEQTYKKIIKVN
ncbi:T9SS type A sorting domain-containing protein, partial [Eudoraea chungangensis]|uniref:T9SS type A sorting domain-containing protein n=1 Tax=Eudoraea chungangensis TaxID=1481905 RepID=UPI0023EB7367